MTAIVWLAMVTAVVAGVRSTWSPCGASVLSTMTAMGEASRGHRWGVAASWYVVGTLVGGAGAGLGAAALTPATGLLTPISVLVTAGVVGGTAALFDGWRGGRALPPRTRQLNEDDPTTYRTWVYGLWWGLQVGCGFATISMTAGVYLTFALAALTGSPWWAVATGLLFGLTRGLAVVPARWLTNPTALRAFHRRMARLDEPTRRITLGWLMLASSTALMLVRGMELWAVPTYALALCAAWASPNRAPTALSRHGEPAPA